VACGHCFSPEIQSLRNTSVVLAQNILNNSSIYRFFLFISNKKTWKTNKKKVQAQNWDVRAVAKIVLSLGGRGSTCCKFFVVAPSRCETESREVLTRHVKTEMTCCCRDDQQQMFSLIKEQRRAIENISGGRAHFFNVVRSTNTTPRSTGRSPRRIEHPWVTPSLLQLCADAQQATA